MRNVLLLAFTFCLSSTAGSQAQVPERWFITDGSRIVRPQPFPTLDECELALAQAKQEDAQRRQRAIRDAEDLRANPSANPVEQMRRIVEVQDRLNISLLTAQTFMVAICERR